MADWYERLPDVPCSDAMLLCCVCGRLLDEPQLLRCLHSCCHSCLQQLSSACAEDDRQATGAMAANPTCPICQEVSSDVTCNSFLGSRVSRHIAIAKSSLCGMCAAKGDAPQQADAWCTLCRMSFCETCLPYHEICHKAHSAYTCQIDEVKSWDEAFPTPSPLCSIHQKPFDFLCFSCKTCCCGDCWPSCAKHDVQHVRDPIVASYVEKARGDLAYFARMLLSKADVLNKRKQLAAALKSDFQNDLKKLKDTKRQLLTAIDDVYSTLEKRLRDTYDSLRATADAISRSSKTMEHKVHRAAKYSSYVADVGLSSELLMQEQSLLLRMKSLCAELDQLEQPLEAGQYVAFDSPPPADEAQLVDLVTSWFGSPRATTDNLFASKAQPDRKLADDTCGIPDVHRRSLDSWRSTDLNIGVIGASGVGKSSLINTLRRLRVDDPGAAPADVMQTTVVPTSYAHPQYPKVKLWDLPGVGTPKFPRGSYLQNIDFHKYDFFLIICCLRFTEDDLCFARAVHQANKCFCFVRTKVDDDVRHDREDHPSTHNELEVLRRMRDYCVTELSKAGFTDPLVFLVCKNSQLFDFPALEAKLLTILLDSKPVGV